MQSYCARKPFESPASTIDEGRFGIRKSPLCVYMLCLFVGCAGFLFVTKDLAYCAPTVFPGGLTLSDPDKVYDGYTIYALEGLDKVFVLDIAGNEMHSWNIAGLSEHVKPLPKGRVLVLIKAKGESGMLQMDDWDIWKELDWDGNVLWEYRVPAPLYKFHHDIQRLSNGNTLIIASRMRNIPSIAARDIQDDVIIEVTPSGEVLWWWSVVDHYDQLGLSTQAKKLIAATTVADIFHTNSIQSLPHNKHESTDERFKAGNILVSQRDTNLVFIIDKLTGNIVWTMKKTIAQHHARMIPPTLIGAGNIIVFDNGGWGGYPIERRTYSRVLEFDPVTKKSGWVYTAMQSGNRPRETFFSVFRSGQQRLPNGNTLITESTYGRIFEVTRAGEIVWEYVNPHFREKSGQWTNDMYRTYRVDKSWPVGQTGPGEYPFPW
jgi:hypothetical protein